MSPVGSLHEGREIVKESLFNGGMSRENAAHMIADGECRLMKNCYYPRETMSPRTRPGLVPHTTTEYASAYEALNAITAVTVFKGGGASGAGDYIVFTALNKTSTQQGLYYVDTDEKWVAVTENLGSLGKPTLCVYGGYLLVAIAGQYIKCWNGLPVGTPTNSPARASGTITVSTYTNVAAGEQLTVGARTFTFQTVRAQPGEITIGGSNDAMATNIAAAIATDCWDVSAAVGSAPNTNVVTVTARETGTIGNTYPLVDGTGAMTLSGATLASGAAGCQIDTIDSYLAPKPGIVVSDKNQRLIGAGDTTGGTLKDRVYFSAPGNPWQWAYGDYGDGEFWDVGYREGNEITAVVPHLGELIVHKSGANKEIYRLDLSNPEPNTWAMQRRFFSGATAAVSQAAAVSIADKHLMLDTNFFRAFTGNDAYDEIRSGVEANKVYDYLNGTVAATGFIAVHPRELYALVFPAAGNVCLVYHYGSGRWTSWEFLMAANVTITCAAFSETLDSMIFGASDGFIYVQDFDYASDTSSSVARAFNTVIVGKAVSGGLHGLLLKHSVLEWENHLAGTGSLKVQCDLNESDIRTIIGQFGLTEAELRVYAATMTVYAATMTLGGDDAFSIAVSSQQARAGWIAPRIEFTGAATIIGLVQKIAQVGLRGEA